VGGREVCPVGMDDRAEFAGVGEWPVAGGPFRGPPRLAAVASGALGRREFRLCAASTAGLPLGCARLE
jgi:hypothetical protein